MGKLKSIKGLDDYGYEVTFDLPTIEEASDNLRSFVEALDSWQVSAIEAADSIRRVSELLARVSALEDMIDSAMSNIVNLETRIDQSDLAFEELAAEIDELRPVTDAEIEIPNQNDNLDFLNQIVPDKDFLFLTDGIGWSKDICDMDKTNMFLS